MILLAVSGGPDSMFMLNEYKKNKIIVAHVNYNTRKNSKDESLLIKNFCSERNIPYYELSIKYPGKGNFEAWARNVRYEFFADLYKEHNCNKLLTAHHKDDFLETALMQQRTGRTPKFFGIKKKINRLGMNIYRPYVNSYWKKDILEYLSKDNIAYIIDDTNFDPNYALRNKVRAEVSEWTFAKKKDTYSWFKMSNKILNKKNKKVDNLYKKWEKTNFSLEFYRILRKYQLDVAYEYVIRHFDQVKLSGAKLKSLADFINGNKGGAVFKLNTQHSIKKEKKNLVVL